MNHWLTGEKEDQKLSGIEKNGSLATQEFYGDYNMVNAVLRNLISNAIKYTPRKGGVIISSQGTTTDDTPMIEVSIQDSGIGISSDYIDQIFKSEKVHSSPGTEGERGTGIGLLLCKEFVEKNNGNISATSEYGKGSTFIFQYLRLLKSKI